MLVTHSTKLILLPAGTDYSTVTRTVTFPAGETSTTVSVSTLDDSVAEGTETFQAFLSSPMPSASVELGDQDTATATILDNDGIVFLKIAL